MALEFFDGFEIYGTDSTFLTQGRYTGAQNANFSAGTVRTGSVALQLNNTSAFLRKTDFSSQARRVFGFGFRSGSGTQRIVFSATDGTSNQVSLRFNGDGTFSILNGDGTTVLGTSTLTIELNTWYYVELDVTINNTTGAARLRVDEVDFLNLTNVDTQNTANATCSGFSLLLSGTGNTFYDDLYVDSDTLRGVVAIHKIVPNGNGNSSNMTGSDGNSTDNYLLVDDNTGAGGPDDDTTYVQSSTVGHKDTYAMSDLGSVAGEVLALQLHTRAKKVDVGARSFKQQVRTGSTDYEGAEKSLTTSYAYYTNIWTTNPGTTNAWSLSEIDGIEAGYKVHS